MREIAGDPESPEFWIGHGAALAIVNAFDRAVTERDRLQAMIREWYEAACAATATSYSAARHGAAVTTLMATGMDSTADARAFQVALREDWETRERVLLNLASAWHYGAFRAETATEREMEADMAALQLWPITEEELTRRRASMTARPTATTDAEVRP